MRRIPLAALALSAAALVPGSLADDPPPVPPKVALLIVQDRAGDSRAARAVERQVLRDLAARARVSDPLQVRDLLRRGRIRNGDVAPAEVLRELARELDVDWLLSLTIHDAERLISPRLTLSARIYDGASGQPLWAGFASGSGLDGKKALGLGELTDTTVQQTQRVPGAIVVGFEPDSFLVGLDGLGVTPLPGEDLAELDQDLVARLLLERTA